MWGRWGGGAGRAGYRGARGRGARLPVAAQPEKGGERLRDHGGIVVRGVGQRPEIEKSLDVASGELSDDVDEESGFVHVVNRRASSRTMYRSIAASQVLKNDSGTKPFPMASTASMTSAPVFAEDRGDRSCCQSRNRS